VDFASIAATAVAALTPYLKKAAEDFAGKAGELALEKVKALFQTLKDKFSADGYMQGTLERFEKDPDKFAPAVQQVIEEAAAEDDSFARDVETLVQEIEAVGPSIKVVQKIKRAREVLGVEADDVGSGSIDVRQDIGNATKVTGVKLGKVGSPPKKS